jgi:predicted hydrocarbon binding protein
MLDEAVEWATGQRHLVEEVSCMAQSAAACRFRIGK